MSGHSHNDPKKDHDSRLNDIPHSELSSPKIFISHRHDDSKLAELLRNFIRQRANNVEIFQSSYEAGGPAVGQILSVELGQHLAESELILLIYTLPDENWSYCMWEVGVGFNPRNEDTRIVVLQAGSAIPAPLGDRKAVRLTQEADVRQFVNQLLTGKEFFPKYKRSLWSVTENTANDVHQAATALVEKLRELGVTPEQEEEASWRPWHEVTLSLPLNTSNHIYELRKKIDENSQDENKFRSEIYELIKSKVYVIKATTNAGQLFGIHIESNTRLVDLIDSWEDDRGCAADWGHQLIGHIRRAAEWRFTLFEHCGFLHALDNEAYVPILARVTRKPRADVVELVFIFPRVAYDEARGEAVVPIVGCRQSR